MPHTLLDYTGGVLGITIKDCELTQSDLENYPEVKPGNFVVLSVSDTGAGINPDIWGRIFDPYFTTKGVGKGSGMGLSIVHGIVTSYGGFITSGNNSPKGTIFRVYLPAIDQKIVPEVTPVSSLSSGNEHIFLVDDEVMLAEMGKAMLEKLGYEVIMRTNSSEALAIFQNHPNLFDAVIRDQTMPCIAGIDFARQILQIRPDIPIILYPMYRLQLPRQRRAGESCRNQGLRHETIE